MGVEADEEADEEVGEEETRAAAEDAAVTAAASAGADTQSSARWQEPLGETRSVRSAAQRAHRMILRTVVRAMRASAQWIEGHAEQIRKPLVLAAILLVGLSATLFVVSRLSPTSSRRPSPIPREAQTQIPGSLIGVVRLGASGSGLGVIDPSSGALLSVLLAPDGQILSYIAPAYAPARRLLAFIAIAKDGVRNVEVTALLVTPDAPPRVVQPAPRIVVANCGSLCNTLAWTPNGDQVNFEGMDGLVAVNPFTSEQQPVTQGAHDAWPACSPDGGWLTYQHDVETAGYTEGFRRWSVCQ